MDGKNLTVVEIRILQLRTSRNISQEQLAHDLGVSRSTVSSWETGYYNISLKQLIRLSYYYQVPIDYILGLTSKFDFNDYQYIKELDLKYLGNKIRMIRKVELFNQVNFAKKIHTNVSSLSRIELGKRSISTADLKEICNTFGYSADWCCGNTQKCIRRKPNIQLSQEEIRTFIPV